MPMKMLSVDQLYWHESWVPFLVNHQDLGNIKRCKTSTLLSAQTTFFAPINLFTFLFFFNRRLVSYTLCIQLNWSFQLSPLCVPHPSPPLTVQTLDLSATCLPSCVMLMRILIALTHTTLCTIRWASSVVWFKSFVGCYPFNSRQNSAESLGFSSGKCYGRCIADEPVCPTSLEILQLFLSLTQLVLSLASSRPARTGRSSFKLFLLWHFAVS